MTGSLRHFVQKRKWGTPDENNVYRHLKPKESAQSTPKEAPQVAVECYVEVKLKVGQKIPNGLLYIPIVDIWVEKTTLYSH